MTLERFVEINKINGTYQDVIPSRKMVKYLSYFKHIETVELFYDDEDKPDDCQWFDIEGIGYGWLWLQHKNSTRLQRKTIIKYAMTLLLRCKKDKFFKSVNDDFITMFFEEKDGDIIQITVSNEPSLKNFVARLKG